MQISVSRNAAAVLVAVFVACAAAVGYVSGAAAQQTVTYPAVLTGDQIGFLPAAPGSATGVLVVRIDGKWVPAQFTTDAPGIIPLAR
jgi:hypothetical protein